MPLLKEENPRIGENLSAMALRLRLDEEALSRQAEFEILPTVEQLKAMDPAIRSRCLDAFLKKCGVREPEQTHIAAAEKLLFSDKPSARVSLPGGVTIARRYDRLEKLENGNIPEDAVLPSPGEIQWDGWRVVCEKAAEIRQDSHCFTVKTVGPVTVGSRRSGDELRLSGGTKSLKKLFIDRKIPAAERSRIPVLRDENGVLAAAGIGVNLDRAAEDLPAVTIRFEQIQ